MVRHLGMNWNIFSGLDTKAAVSQAKLKVSQLQEQNQGFK
jgi:hypothetical protein